MKRGLIADPSDNVGMVLETILPGEDVVFDSMTVRAKDEIHMPNKIALCSIPKGAAVRKFGGIIGYATQDIGQGALVHTHNLSSGEQNTEKR